MTYPLTTATCWRCPRPKVVRGFDVWRVLRPRDLRGRHRHLLGTLAVLEYLSAAQGNLPDGVTPTGPDATGVGWVFQYALTGSE